MEHGTNGSRWLTWSTVAILGATCWVSLARPGEGWFETRVLRLPALAQREEAVSQALHDSWNQRRRYVDGGTVASASMSTTTARETALLGEVATIRRQIRQVTGD